MKLYCVKENYIEYLKAFDSLIADNKKEKRPYVGIVLEIGDIKYYAPLSSPKEKHNKMKNTIDFRKINGGLYGVINLNNMIPVIDDVLVEIDIDKEQDKTYKRLLQNQYVCLENDWDKICNSATKLRKIIFESDINLNPFNLMIKKRSCNLPLLESIYKNYKK